MTTSLSQLRILVDQVSAALPLAIGGGPPLPRARRLPRPPSPPPRPPPRPPRLGESEVPCASVKDASGRDRIFAGTGEGAGASSIRARIIGGASSEKVYEYQV